MNTFAERSDVCPQINISDRNPLHDRLQMAQFVTGVWLSVHVLGLGVRIVLEYLFICEDDFLGQRSRAGVLQKISGHSQALQSVDATHRRSCDGLSGACLHYERLEKLAAALNKLLSINLINLVS